MGFLENQPAPSRFINRKAYILVVAAALPAPNDGLDKLGDKLRRCDSGLEKSGEQVWAAIAFGCRGDTMGIFKAFSRTARAHARGLATNIAWGVAKERADTYIRLGKPLDELRGILEENGLLDRDKITFIIRTSIQDHIRAHPELCDIFNDLPKEERMMHIQRVMEGKGYDTVAADAFARFWFTVGYLEKHL